MFEGTIVELPQDPQKISGQHYRRVLYHVAQSAKLTGSLYLAIRLFVILSASNTTWQIWTMFFLEAFFVHLVQKEQSLTTLATQDPESRPRNRLRLQGDKDLPRVDVLLPCCGEETDVIMQTVHAACTMDYPTSHFRVLVLDDGQSASLKMAISDLRAQWPHLSYHSRGRQSGQVFAKSGNLNYALTTLQTDFQPEFCAILDADSIPTREFLRATLPHLLLDPDAALVSTRQYFSNLPVGDLLCQSRAHFYTSQNAKLDILGKAIDSGSGAVFRRQSIVDVGLYPTYSFSEDWQLSLLLRGMGYKTFQVDEALQFGLVPTSLAGHIAQRKRWNIGHAQQMSAMLSSKGSHMPSWLRFSIARNGFGIVFEELGCLLGFAAVPLLLFSGQKLVPTSESSPALVTLQFGLSLAQLFLSWASETLQVIFTGNQSTAFGFLENKWLSGTNIYGILRFYLISKKPKGSFVTGSRQNSHFNNNESSIWMRLYRDLWGNGLIYSILLLLITLASILHSLTTVSDGYGVFTHRLTTIAWPQLVYICVMGLKNHIVPVLYLIDPPKYAERTNASNEAVSSQQKTGKHLINSEAIQSTMKSIHKVGEDILNSGKRLEINEETVI